MRAIGRYLLNTLLSLDQLLHVIASPIVFYRVADADETWSSRTGKVKVANDGTVPWKYPIAKLVDEWILELLDKNHSIDAIEEDED